MNSNRSWTLNQRKPNPTQPGVLFGRERAYRPSDFTIRKPGHAYETLSEPSTRDAAGITEDIPLKLQFLRSIHDHIADADDG
jgi:hypothetical protein